MKKLAIIGGTGLETMAGLDIVRHHQIETPYGDPSSAIVEAQHQEDRWFFLSRHGEAHTIPPHRVNYRANLWALHSLSVDAVVAVAAVGGITEAMLPGQVSIPDQIIDYTWGREHTFYDGPEVEHIDFTHPYCESLRGRLIEAATAANVAAIAGGTYGATQGPRLESPAEICRMEQDGCDIVGMTGMPEASLAKELGLCYACCAVSANWAAGKVEGEITMEEITENLKGGMAQVTAILRHLSVG